MCHPLITLRWGKIGPPQWGSKMRINKTEILDLLFLKDYFMDFQGEVFDKCSVSIDDKKLECVCGEDRYFRLYSFRGHMILHEKCCNAWTATGTCDDQESARAFYEKMLRELE
jgi:hypothetical protein